MASDSTFWLQPRPPFRLDLTVWAIRRRPENRIDYWDGKTYSRILVIGDRPVKVCITEWLAPESSGSQLRVMLTGGKLDRVRRAEIVAAVDRLLGIRIDLRPFFSFAGRDARLFQLAQRFRGLKPPQFPSIFEALVNGIACQQLSLAVGITLLNRLAEAYGLRFGRYGDTQYAFPRPEDLATATVSDLRQLGLSSNKGRALIELASAVAGGDVDLEPLASNDDQAAIARLLGIRGVGRWTAEYVLLRGLGRTNVFPGDDVGARNNLARWLKLRKELDYGGVSRTLAKWKPYAGLVYFHLLMDSLERSGYIDANPAEQ